jgi:hypothetical protein
MKGAGLPVANFRSASGSVAKLWNLKRERLPMSAIGP